LNSRFANGGPSDDDVSSIVALMTPLREKIAQEHGAHPDLVDQARGALARASGIILRNSGAFRSKHWLDLVVECLLDASRSDVPRYSEERDASFDKNISWEGGLARMEAAQRLMRLAICHASPTVLAAIDLLSRDQVNSVRYLTDLPTGSDLTS
jgi:hypothetical protein